MNAVELGSQRTDRYNEPPIGSDAQLASKGRIFHGEKIRGDSVEKCLVKNIRLGVVLEQFLGSGLFMTKGDVWQNIREELSSVGVHIPM